MSSGIPNIAARVRQINRRINSVSRAPQQARTSVAGQQAVNVNAGAVNTAVPARSDFNAILEAQPSQGILGSLTDSEADGANSDILASVLGGTFPGNGDFRTSSLIDLLPRLDGNGGAAVIPFGANFKYNPFRDLEVTSPFGPRELGGVAEQHNGLDLALPVGTPLPSIGSGRVVSAGEDGVFGRNVVYQLDTGEVIRYAHMKADAPFPVTEGQRITPGQTVGISGNTGRSSGPHLHVSVQVGGEYVDPRSFLWELP